MKLAIFLEIFMALTLSVVGAQEHSHPPTHNQIQLNHGQKWKTDAPLRKGMGEIRKQLSLHLPMEGKRVSNKETFMILANRIEEQIQFLFKNCKLSPEADAQLHIVIKQMLDGAKKMKEPSETSVQHLGFREIVEAINLYGDHFDHPNWVKIDERHGKAAN